mmetsp:Transcript_21730/g.33530  ORF Transcript_21730/g.33530 Transcript_21730/m.33530 type:complete len:128 (+) Transcript_21730:1308-1691(+)|eukprot:CAMPEP_0170491770 /NCGR_PEP_ID=MMETSP0208-20121228/11240_1 /TAXON_ID=197538 /ORGANISM="Strombidium inclinatum, Strain S3" /LENGTH=127 /DNA_ID=CAMNT_0010767397 /DNA_START=1308 /DNA_END=1691 /DNA_ORIENTATION=+
MRVKIDIEDFKLKVDKIVDSKIGKVHEVKIINAILSLMEVTIRKLINLFFSKGFSLEYIFELLHIDFFTFKATKLEPRENYFLFFFTPEFNIDDIVNRIMQLSNEAVDAVFGKDGDLEVPPEWVEAA